LFGEDSFLSEGKAVGICSIYLSPINKVDFRFEGHGVVDEAKSIGCR